MILILTAFLWLISLAVTLVLRRRSDAWHDLLCLGLIGAATAGFFWRLFFTPNVWMPAGGGDLAQFLYPTFSFAADSWRHGVVPLWNPHLFAGAPFVGDSQSGLFYPINLLTFFLSSPLTFRDMEFLSVLHHWIAGASMYAFLRWGRWGHRGQANGSDSLSRGAALLGAIAFEFSDLFITHFGNLNLIAVASWMPLVLLFYRRALTDRRPSYAIASGVILAVAFMAGHPQAFLFIVVTLVLFALFHSLGVRNELGKNGDWQSPITQSPNHPVLTSHPAFRSFAYLTMAAFVAFGLAAPSLFPVFEMAQRTVRTSYTYEQAAQYSLPPAQLVGLVVPGFFGRGPQNAWGPWPRVEAGYIGILPLLLGLLGLTLRRDTWTRWFGFLSLVGLGLALGGYAILHGWLYQFVPGFGQLRAPARFVFVFDFAVAGLAAFCLDTLLHALPRSSEIAFKRFVRAAPWAYLLIALAGGSTAYAILILGQGQDAVLFDRMARAVNGVVFFLLLLGLALGLVIARARAWFRPGVWSALVLALVFFDLSSLGASVDVGGDNPVRVFDHPDVVGFLRDQGGLDRVDARGTGVDAAWPADTSILHRLYDVGGDNPLVLADFDRYWQSLGSRSSTLYDLLNVKYLIGRKNVPLDRSKFQLAYDGDPAVDVFENMRALPRAFIAYDSQAVSDSERALAAIHAPDFDPLRTAVVESGRAPFATGAPVATEASRGAVKITGYGPNEILLETDAAKEGILVLSEVYYPGWRVWIDNVEAQPLRADFLFRAVALPAGVHQVRWLYDPDSLRLGAVLLSLTVLAIAGWEMWDRTPSRRPSSSPAS